MNARSLGLLHVDHIDYTYERPVYHTACKDELSIELTADVHKMILKHTWHQVVLCSRCSSTLLRVRRQ